MRDGHYLGMAASAAGVSRSTVFDWLRRGRLERQHRESGEPARRSERRFLDFLDSVEQAEYEPAELALSSIRRAAEAGQWRAGAWFLIHRHPRSWGGHDAAADLQDLPPARKDRLPWFTDVSNADIETTLRRFELAHGVELPSGVGELPA